jgi:hypothetical protein
MPHPFETWEARRLKPVVFKYPELATRTFWLDDEARAASSAYEDIGEYVFLLQHLTSGEKRQIELIRATYYRKPPSKSRWVFAGQYSLTAERKYWLSLLADALKKDWFRSLIDEAQAMASEP